MDERPGKTAGHASGVRAAPAERLCVLAASAATAAFIVLLSVRTLTTPDLGYHLAYGEHFLDTGGIVDSGLFIYPTGPQASASNPATAPRGLPGDLPRAQSSDDLGPGCWYDASGNYRFPNANWLSQVIMAAVHRAAGATGLSILLAATVAGTFAFTAAAMRRLHLSWLTIAAGSMLTALVAYERFEIRPEVFGYLVLAAQLWLLAARRVSLWSGLAVILLQALLVNLHSYFLLGLALTAAGLAEALLRRAWNRCAARSAQPPDEAAVRAQARRLALILAGQLAVCLANPWTWRLAILPVQTLAFIHRNGIAASELRPDSHPWAHIGEFFRPFVEAVAADRKATYAYIVLLALAAAGSLAAAIRRRWGYLLVIAGMTAVSLAMRRNLAAAALLLTPPALAACREFLAGLFGRPGRPGKPGRPDKVRRPARPPEQHPAAGEPDRPAAADEAPRPGPPLARLRMVLAGGLALAAACGCLAIITQRFYRNERLSVRFGLGLTATVVPVGPAEWINRHDPVGRMWTDYNTSSNMLYFTRPHRQVPILTNTWAYPPSVMRRVLGSTIGLTPFRQATADLDCQIVVLQVNPEISPRLAPLGRQLVNDPSWALVFLDAAHAVFLRTDGANAELARRSAITPRSIELDLDAFEKRLRALEPGSWAGGHAVYLAGHTLGSLGWYAQAIALFQRVLAEDPYPHRVWNSIGWCHARLGTARMLGRPPDIRGVEDWRQAERCFLKALEIQPDYAPARQNLALVRDQLAKERQGILYDDPW